MALLYFTELDDVLSLSDQNEYIWVPFEFWHRPFILVDSTTSAILDTETTQWVASLAFLPQDAGNLAKYPLDVLAMMGVTQAVRLSIALVYFSRLNCFICF